MEMHRLIPGLVDDVVGEIFHHFVAIDWEGPFLLMLVSTKWRDLVLSRPSFWTWVKLDDTQVDWREKALIGKTLSRGLPLHLVVRVPFVLLDELSELLHLCDSIFLDTSTHTRRYIDGPGPIGREQFIEHEPYYKDVQEVVTRALSVLSCAGIPISVESSDGACFAYSTWTIRTKLRRGISIRDQLHDLPLHLVTRLVFRSDTHFKYKRPSINDIWPYLPALPFLQDLELSNNFLGVEKLSDLADISLASLKRLKIECRTGRLSKPLLKDGHRTDLFGLLNCLQAPCLYTLSLRGSHYTIHDVKAHAYRLRVPTFELAFEDPFEPNWQLSSSQTTPWYWLTRYTIDFSTTYIYTLAHILNQLLAIVPVGCLLQLTGGKELMPYTDKIFPSLNKIKSSKLESTQSEVYEVEYQVPPSPDMGVADDQRFGFQKDLNVICLTVDGYFTSRRNRILQKRNPERLVLTKNCLPNYSIGNLLWRIADFTTLKSLDIGDCVGANDFFRHPTPTVSLISLTSLRCRADLFFLRSTMMLLPQLTDLTLTHPIHLPQSWPLKFPIYRQSYFSKPITLRFEQFPSPWSSLLDYIISFNQSNIPGFTTAELPGQLHPSLLLPLVQALRGDPKALEADQVDQSLAKTDLLACSTCRGSGWTCFGESTCMRFSTRGAVAVTKQTFVTESDYVR
ncbi:hypothetical protein M408DRAFT_28159 [Serendipita vermifera MAFF 305830]|uniref:F-box domain-containing protein n=1 Tax=Serendipita vermifera MAFF 305830 TaxID=933852 RepID=A0A0C3AV96_SERVB|nr:hypothetical protein M408DRAFT_28159 [Serendipita vermifera MAFF 305830]